MRMVKAILPEF